MPSYGSSKESSGLSQSSASSGSSGGSGSSGSSQPSGSSGSSSGSGSSGGGNPFSQLQIRVDVAWGGNPGVWEVAVACTQLPPPVGTNLNDYNAHMWYASPTVSYPYGEAFADLGLAYTDAEITTHADFSVNGALFSGGGGPDVDGPIDITVTVFYKNTSTVLVFDSYASGQWSSITFAGSFTVLDNGTIVPP